MVLEYGQLVLVALGMLLSQMLLKRGMGEGGALPLSVVGVAELIRQILTTPTLLVGYGIGGITTLAWLVTLSRLDLSLASPTLTGIYFVLLLLSSAFILREDVSLWRWGGTLLIIVGIVVMARGASPPA